VDYLTMLDVIYIVSMVYILAAMAYTTLASRRNRAEMAQALTAKLDRRVGLISLVVPVEQGEREVELELPGRYAVTPALRGALRVVNGVQEVEEV
jgi:hypothetical protein